MATKKPAAAVQQDGVHTSAQTDTAPASAPTAVPAEGCGACRPKPPEHQASALAPRDKYTGKGGSYVRDPITGERKPATV